MSGETDNISEGGSNVTFTDGQVSGNAGINQYNPSYEVDGETLTIMNSAGETVRQYAFAAE